MDNPYGFDWGPFQIIRAAQFNRAGTWRVVQVRLGDKPKLDIYLSPTGQSIRVFKGGRELR